MKERPIIFNDAMVRAILEGRKTQTRRTVKPMSRRVGREFTGWVLPEYRGDCPFGKPGDRLWVRECWRVSSAHDCLAPRDIPSDVGVEYRADNLPGIFNSKGRPSIHMPRWASRITLEITGVRVERLQDINEADAIAEGCEGERYSVGHGDSIEKAPSTIFSELWQSIYGAESWQSNPWVWVVEFRRVCA